MDVTALHDYVSRQFPGFGINKHHAVMRLLYEISQNDHMPYDGILPQEILRSKDFAQVRSFLVRLRYPLFSREELEHIPPLAELNFPDENRADICPAPRIPKKVYYEHDVAASALLENLRNQLPDSSFEEIEHYRDYSRSQEFSILEYNRRYETLFVAREDYNAFLSCPCSNPSRPCGYQILNIGMGCSFDCVYCYLQGYVNTPGLMISANLEEMLQKSSQHFRSGMRIGTGQFTDSLVLDHLTGFSHVLISFFKNYPDVTLELKTKSNNIENVLNHPAPSRNIIISWSLNPQSIISTTEYLTASLDSRLAAARQCVDAGYRVGFHFDPIIYYDGWWQEYQDVVGRIFEMISPGDIAWISLGCLRMTLKAHQIMEQRFPDSLLGLAQHQIGYDGKLRYPRRIRKDIYTALIKMIRQHSKDVLLYLCMEDEQVNQELDISEFDKVVP